MNGGSGIPFSPFPFPSFWTHQNTIRTNPSWAKSYTLQDPTSGTLNTETSESEDKGKKRKKSGSSKKLLAKAAEEARLQLLRQKQEFLRETKARVQAEWEANHMKGPVIETEFQEKLTLLENSMKRINEIENMWKEYIRENRKYDEWLQYLKCDGLPDPISLPEINSYIYSWTEINMNTLMNHCLKRADEVMEILKGLEEAISNPSPDWPPNYVKDLKEIRATVRDLLQEQIDKTTFCLFSNIESEMEPINVTTSKYSVSCPHFDMCLWAELITPIPSKRNEIRKPLKICFEEIQITVILPAVLLDIHKVVRATLVYYDHWSDKCRTYDCPPLPHYYSLSMCELLAAEFELKTEIMESREKQENIVKTKVAAMPPEPTLSQEILVWSSEPQRALSEEIMFRECDETDNLGRQVKEFLNEFEINLRERTFLGSLLLLEVLLQPPQSHCLRLKHCVTLRKKPPELQPADYYVKFPPPGTEVLEEVENVEDETMSERELKPTIIPPSPAEVEQARNKLVVIRAKFDNWVLWFERPQVGIWDPVRGYWSREDVHEVVFDEEEEEIIFKTGRLGLVGLHVARYVNLPYEDWRFEKDEQEGVIKFYLKTAKMTFYFKIKAGKVCVEWMENAPGRAMNWILGKYYSPTELMKALKKGGIDIFPDPDASAYVDARSKHIVIEKNIYQVWGLFSKTHRFKRSKFNQDAGRGNIVVQAQEIYEGHQVDYCLIQTSMCSSYVLDVSEESENYSPQPAADMETCIDFNTLLHKYSTQDATRQAEVTCTLLIQTIKEFLSLVRPISFS